jgi:hypothetical protein
MLATGDALERRGDLLRGTVVVATPDKATIEIAHDERWSIRRATEGDMISPPLAIDRPSVAWIAEGRAAQQFNLGPGATVIDFASRVRRGTT